MSTRTAELLAGRVCGRAAECAAIEDLLERAVSGEAGVLCLTGAAGVGKTALLEAAADSPTMGAAGVTVLRAVGVQWERGLPLAGLVELLRPLRRLVAQLPAETAELARALLGDCGRAPRDRFAVGVATLGLLGAAAERAPVLVLVDDAQWLDELSGVALAFALRRLRADRLAALLSVRTGESSAVPGPWPVLTVSGLPAAAVGELLRELTGAPVPAPVVERLTAATGGNPLAIIESVRSLSVTALRGAEPVPDPLPLGPRIAVSYAKRLGALPEPARTAVRVVAAAGSAPHAVKVAGLAGAGCSLEDLSAAEHAELLRVEPTTVEFTHPLIREAAMAGSASARRRAHAALAAATAGIDVERHAWHLAAAACGPDPQVVSALTDAAAIAAARGGPAAAAAALATAAELSPLEDPDRPNRQLSAAVALFLAGHGERAVGLLLDTLRCGTPAVAADAALVLGHMRIMGQLGTGDGVPDFDELAGIASIDDRHGAFAAIMRAVAARIEMDAPTLLTAAERAWRLADRLPEGNQLSAQEPLTVALIWQGRRHDPRVGEYVMLARRELDTPAADFTQAVVPPVWPLIWLGEFDLAEALLLKRWAPQWRGSPLGTAAFRCFRGIVFLATGRLPAATALLADAIELADQIGCTIVATTAHAYLAWAHAWRADASACRWHAQRASEVAGVHHPSLHVIARYALGLLALHRGEHGEAAARLGLVADLVRSHDRMLDPGVIPWQADYAEALVAAGRPDEATVITDELRQVASQTGSAWSAALAARTRGLLIADSRDALPLLTQGAGGDLRATPVEHARALLAFGQRARRAQQIKPARVALEEARRLFTDLGCAGWLDRTNGELRAAGVGAGPPSPTPGTSLTAQELQVALAASAGQTTREIATDLYLSPKTVEYHLRKVYTKLGITGRAQLAHAVGGPRPGSSRAPTPTESSLLDRYEHIARRGDTSGYASGS